jgi:hypothetical protein
MLRICYVSWQALRNYIFINDELSRLVPQIIVRFRFVIISGSGQSLCDSSEWYLAVALPLPFNRWAFQRNREVGMARDYSWREVRRRPFG